jgi:hypothetical protein
MNQSARITDKTSLPGVSRSSRDISNQSDTDIRFLLKRYKGLKTTGITNPPRITEYCEDISGKFERALTDFDFSVPLDDYFKSYFPLIQHIDFCRLYSVIASCT